MNRDPDDLPALFAAVHDGTISPADHARLEALLASDPAARQRWFLHCDVESGLSEWAALRQAQQQAEHVLPFAHVPAGTPRRPRAWLRPLSAAAAIVTFLAIATFWWATQSHSRRLESAPREAAASGVAVLTRAVGVEWADGLSPQPGAVLEPGTLKLKTGAALVEFYSGARLVVEGPAELRLVSGHEAFLQSGRINAHVSPQARGFTVSSPGLRVVDFGTDFGVSAAPGSAPEVHVFTGKVEVAATGAAPQALSAGQATRLEGQTLQPIPAVRSEFLPEAELARRDSALAQQRFQAWRVATPTLSNDPSTLIHYTFEYTDEHGRRIANQNPSFPSTQGLVVGGSWTEGRWPGKFALQFRTESDRVRFTVPGAPQAITLLAWVRVEALPRWQNILLATDSKEPGALHWHLMQTGELRLEIARDLGRSHPDWEAVNSTPFLTPERLDQWVLLVTTFDGKTIRHYGNGEPIGSGASFTPPALHLGTAELGNWHGGTQRHLSGAMDEFAILSRVLSPAEIRALYALGHP